MKFSTLGHNFILNCYLFLINRLQLSNKIIVYTFYFYIGNGCHHNYCLYLDLDQKIVTTILDEE